MKWGDGSGSQFPAQLFQEREHNTLGVCFIWVVDGWVYTLTRGTEELPALGYFQFFFSCSVSFGRSALRYSVHHYHYYDNSKAEGVVGLTVHSRSFSPGFCLVAVCCCCCY